MSEAIKRLSQTPVEHLKKAELNILHARNMYCVIHTTFNLLYELIQRGAGV